MRPVPRRGLLATALLTAVLAVGGCGGDDGTVEDRGHIEGEVSELEHVHGLGVSPHDGALFIATHFGLFRAASDSSGIERIGESRQDIMGFSIADAGRFIGSGHPEPGDAELPPNLGLIESTDGGRTWQPVSLLGEADFHVLESEDERVYGFDGTRGRLMVSDDGGESWEQREPPAPIFDLAIDPGDRDRVVAATGVGLLESRNAGDDWQPLSRELVGLLAWSSQGRLHLVDGAGTVHVSGNGGRSWEPVSSLGGQPVAFVAHGDDLYAALGDGIVKASADGGASWVVRAAP